MCTWNCRHYCSSSSSWKYRRVTYTYFTDAAGTLVLASPNAVTLNGTYYIKGTTASGCSDIQPVVVTINPKPTVVITNPAAVCAPGQSI